MLSVFVECFLLFFAVIVPISPLTFAATIFEGTLRLLLPIGVPTFFKAIQLAINVGLLRPFTAILTPDNPLPIGTTIDIIAGAKPLTVFVIKGPDTLLFAIDKCTLN